MKRLIRGAAALGVIFGCGMSAAFPQSLAEAARKEAERRRQLELQGVEEKVFNDEDVRNTREGSLTTSTPAFRPQASLPEASSRKSARSPQSYSNSLKKLDREIRQSEERLTLLRSRLQAERWAIVTGKSARKTSGNSTQERVTAEIQVLETKLKRLRDERQATYDAGRKAGFHPGELEGRGLVP